MVVIFSPQSRTSRASFLCLYKTSLCPLGKRGLEKISPAQRGLLGEGKANGRLLSGGSIYPRSVFWDADGRRGSEAVLAEWGYSSPAPRSADGDLQHLGVGCTGE